MSGIMEKIKAVALKILRDLKGETIGTSAWLAEICKRGDFKENTVWAVVADLIRNRGEHGIEKVRRGEYRLLPQRGRKSAPKKAGALRAKKTSRKKMFVIRGPLTIPCDPMPGGRVINTANVSQFWEVPEAKKLAGKIGCYIFAIKAGRGFTPIYVGKTVRSFKEECFTPKNLHAYTIGLASVVKGNPVMFFVTPLWNVPNKENNASAGKLIGEVEKSLIQWASDANPDGLLNKQNVGRDWDIQGIHRGAGGKGKKSSTDFRRMLNLDKLAN